MQSRIPGDSSATKRGRGFWLGRIKLRKRKSILGMILQNKSIIMKRTDFLGGSVWKSRGA